MYYRMICLNTFQNRMTQILVYIIYMICLFIKLAVSGRSEDETIYVRLNGGIKPNQGRVEVRRGTSGDEYEQWVSLCDNGFRVNEARVVCRQLGYRHSRVENGIYKEMYNLGADYVLGDVTCDGTEPNIMQCSHSEWGTHNCLATSSSNAGVCCSNSSEFGEYIDGQFISHCAKSWLDSQASCERCNSALSDVSLRSERQLLGGQGVWTSRFVTPWIWSNGCYNITHRSMGEKSILANNSPGACFQLCRYAFGLSGHECTCVDEETGGFTQVAPHHCNTSCAGSTDDLCGHDPSYYSMYSVVQEGTGDIFQHYTPPQASRQCAVLVKTAWKTNLHTHPCNGTAGYVCSRLGKSPMALIGEVARNSTMMSARRQCRDIDDTVRLAGKDIMSTDFKTRWEAQMWIDLTRVQFDKLIQFEQGKISTFHPEWCVAIEKLSDGHIRHRIVKCKQRYGYICQKRRQTLPSEPILAPSPTAPTAARTTRDDATSSERSIQTSPTTDFEKHVVFPVSLIIGSTVLCMILLVLLFCWCCRSGKKNGRVDLIRLRRNSVPTNNSTVSDILTAEQQRCADAVENSENTHTYDVMPHTYAVLSNGDLQNETNLEHTYSLVNCSSSVHGDLKESNIRVYYEYSSPADKVAADERVSEEADDPPIDHDVAAEEENKYIYPYDAICKQISA